MLRNAQRFCLWGAMAMAGAGVVIYFSLVSVGGFFWMGPVGPQYDAAKAAYEHRMMLGLSGMIFGIFMSLFGFFLFLSGCTIWVRLKLRPKQMGLLFFLLGLGVLMPARAADPLPPGTKIFFDSENREDAKAGTIVTEWFILPKTLDKLPAYDPALADPPLSLLKAMGIAREQVNHEVAAPEKWRLDSIELHEIDLGQSGLTIPSGWTPKRTGKWYYKIIFEKPVDAEDIAAKNYSTPCPVYVLMDGSVAEHRERPQTEDEKNSDKDMVTSLKNAFKGDPKKEAKP